MQASLQKRTWKDCKVVRWWMIPRNHCFLNTTGMIHVWTQRECDSIRKTCTSSNQAKSQHGEGKSGTMTYYVETENQCSLMDWHCVHKPHSRASPIAKGSWLTQNRLLGFFGLVWFCIFLSYWFYLLLIIALIFIILKGRERNNVRLGRYIGRT